jgi:hypothetical protein
MAIQRIAFVRRLPAPVSLVFSIAFALALIHSPGCSTTAATSDGSAEGGHGGAGGPGSGGASGESGHSGTGGVGVGSGGTAGGSASGGSSGAGGKAAGGASGAGSGGSGGKGSGGASGGAGGVQSYSCGSDTCTVGQSFCYSYTPGTAGSTGRSCQTTPTACASAPTSCACLCPPAPGTAFGCVPVGTGQGNFCTCDDTNGVVKVSCEGS